MTTLYIAGPMTGYPGYNYPAFMRAESDLRVVGYDTFNPARCEPCDSWDDYMRSGLAQVLRAQGIAVLDGWQMSAGAVLEVHVAQTLRVPVLPVDLWIRKALERAA